MFVRKRGIKERKVKIEKETKTGEGQRMRIVRKCKRKIGKQSEDKNQ